MSARPKDHRTAPWLKLRRRDRLRIRAGEMARRRLGSEDHFDAELYLSRAGHRSGDATGCGQRSLTFSCRREHGSIRRREVGVIEDVEYFEPHLDLSAATKNAKLRILHEREV